MAQYRKKPVVMDAIQFRGGFSSADKAIAWAVTNGCGPGMRYTMADDTIHIQTLEGTMTAQPGDWIIRGVKGEFYPIKPDIFEATYEKEGA